MARQTQPLNGGIRAARRAALFSALWLGATTLVIAAPTWEPIAPEDLAAKESTAEPGADSEYLFWRMNTEDDAEGVSFKYHVRAKIYTTRGVENAGKLHFERLSGSRISRLMARVVKPDGTSIELKKTDFIESEVAKLGSYKLHRTSFAFPTLAPGDIVEYRWNLSIDGGTPPETTFCQQVVPVREFSFELSSSYSGMNATWFHSNVESKSPKNSGVLKLVSHNLPAFVEEPQMPPERETRGWIRLAYVGRERDPVKQWQEYNKDRADYFARMTKPNDAIRKKAAELTAGAATPQESVQRLDRFCREQIINITWSDAPAARQERERTTTRDQQSARETLQRGRGWPTEIDLLFASLLIAAGRDPHLAFNAPTHTLLNTRIQQGWSFMTETHIALREGEKWSFYSPGDLLVPYGMCNAWDEGSTAIVIDPKNAFFTLVPPSPAELSGVQRKARLTLEADGTLHGDIEVAYQGHDAVRVQRDAWEEAQEKTDEQLIDRIKDRVAGAEVTGVKWENLRQTTGAVKVSYQINVPNYAESAGQRLIFAPGYFTRGRKPVFTAPERKHQLMWSHAWNESDEIEIVLPPDLELEQSTSPPPVADTAGAVSAKYQIGYSKKRHTMIYRRNFEFTGKLGLIFAKDDYGAFKNLFDGVNQRDQHSIVLRPKAATGKTDVPAVPAEKPQT